MTVFIALAVIIIAAFTLPAVARSPRVHRRVLAATGAFLLFLAVAMTVYVFSEDDYRHDGRSRWSVYNVQEIYVAAVVITVVAAAAAIVSVWRRPFAWTVPLLAIVAVGTNYVAIASTSN